MSYSHEFVKVPIRFHTKVVAVRLDELPNNQDLLTLLRGEYAPLKTWLQCAIGYYRMGLFDRFLEIMEAVTSNDVGEMDVYKNSKDDRVTLLNVLAAYYTQLASLEPNRQKREELHLKTNQLCNVANRLQDRIQDLRPDSLSLIMSGIHLVKTNVEDIAFNYFNDFLNHIQKSNRVLSSSRNPATIPALLGKLCLLYRLGQYVQAFELAVTIFQIHPNPPPSFRLPLAYIHFKLGNMELSRKAFLRVLELDPKNVEALLGLTVHELNAVPSPNIDAALGFLFQAYAINADHPGVLLRLADLMANSLEYSEAKQYASRLLEVTDDVPSLAEANRILGIVGIAQRDFDQAFHYLKESCRLAPESNPIAYLGLGQIWFWRNDLENANKCFETVLRSPSQTYSVEANLYLGRIKIWQERPQEAIPYFLKVLDLQPSNLLACHHYSQLIQADDPAGALKVYCRVTSALAADGQKVPTFILNNIGVLYFSRKEYPNAIAHFVRALEADESAVSLPACAPTDAFLAQLEQTHAAEHVTIAFNIGRVFEELKMYAEALRVFQAIHVSHPTFIAAELRTARIHQARGDDEAAIQLYQQLVQKEPKNLDLWCMWANFYFEREQIGTAQDLFEMVRKIEPEHPYANLMVGNIQYVGLCQPRPPRAESMAGHAYRCYSRVLHNNPHNIYAANGLGLLMVHHGYMAQALDIFMQIRDSKPDFPDVWLNLGHVYFSQGQYPNAIHTYRHCLDKFYAGKNPDILLLIARAQYEQGSELVERKQFDQPFLHDAIKTLEHAISLSAESSPRLIYNRAMAQGEYGKSLLTNPSKSAGDITAAIACLKEAVQTLKLLSEAPENRIYSSKTVTKRYHYYEKVVGTAISDLDKARLTEAEEARHQARQEAERIRQEQEAEESRQREQQEEDERHRQEYEFFLETERNLKAKFSYQEEGESKPKKSSSSKKKKDQQFIDDNPVDPDRDLVQPIPRRKKAQRQLDTLLDDEEPESELLDAPVEKPTQPRKRTTRPKASSSSTSTTTTTSSSNTSSSSSLLDSDEEIEQKHSPKKKIARKQTIQDDDHQDTADEFLASD